MQEASCPLYGVKINITLKILEQNGALYIFVISILIFLSLTSVKYAAIVACVAGTSENVLS